MDLLPGLKQLEGQLGQTSDELSVHKGKLEDLMLRAQKISAAAKKNMPNPDPMYGYDLRNCRRDLRAFGLEFTAMPRLLGMLERMAVYDLEAGKSATSVMRACSRVSNALKALHDEAMLNHQHVHDPELKIISGYISQEIEEMAQMGMSLPAIANKIVIIATTTPPNAR